MILEGGVLAGMLFSLYSEGMPSDQNKHVFIQLSVSPPNFPIDSGGAPSNERHYIFRKQINNTHCHQKKN